MRGSPTIGDARSVRWATLGMLAGLGVTASGCGSDEPKDTLPTTPCTEAPAEATGEATYYDATGAGNCSFEPSSDLMVAAINATDYGIAAWCGACVNVRGPDGAVTVRIVDKCPGCARGDLDLSREAFEKIAPLAAGRVAISWNLVACEVQGGLGYHWKAGSSQFWSAIQVRNHRYPIATLEARAASAYEALDRVDYNYFVAPDSRIGAGPFTLRITDTRGHVVEDGPIELGDDVVRAGSAQFPACP